MAPAPARWLKVPDLDSFCQVQSSTLEEEDFPAHGLEQFCRAEILVAVQEQDKLVLVLIVRYQTPTRW